jgi:G3E family GTPase
MSIPFYVLCGSLGAGKTTLLMRLLEYWHAEGRRVGVLMNEAGEVSIDGPRAGTIAEQVLNLAGGCVCCDTKEDLSWGLAQLVNDDKSEIVMLECSGMADPMEVIDAVTDLYTARLVRLERVIALLQPCSKEESSSQAYVTSQAIRCADEIILNKRDLYIPGLWDQFKHSIVTQNPYARVWETTHARIDVAVLTASIPSRSQQNRPNVVFGKSHSSETKTGATYHPLATTVRLPGPLNRQRFLDWINTIPKELERAKGFFRFCDETILQEFQYAPPGRPTIAPVTLLDEPDSAIVMIGRGFNIDELCAELTACVGEVESR